MSHTPLSIDDCRNRLSRARNLIGCLETVKDSGTDHCNYLEIGCCFKEDEGLSTYVAAKFIAERFSDGGVLSLELDPDHIRASKEIVRKYDPTLLQRIEWIAGNSIQTLPRLLAKTERIDFAFIDGGAGPSANLFELLHIWDKLSENGIALIDDCAYLHPTPAYSGRRDFGKAQLILPFLLIVEHINHTRRIITEKFDDSVSAIDMHTAMTGRPGVTPFLAALYENERLLDICESYEDMDFLYCGARQLLVARKPIITRLRGDRKTNRIDF